MEKVAITFRVSKEEFDTLKQYCEQESRTQTDVLRDFIRGLRKKLAKPPSNTPSGIPLTADRWRSPCFARSGTAGGSCPLKLKESRSTACV